MRDRRYQSTEKGLDDLADLMLNRINSCVDDRTKKAVRIKSAVVTKVNDDGTVNVQLPDDDGSGFSRLQNQSVYELNVGDSVEILLKEGSFTNSWVIAKHGGGTKRVNLVNQGTLSIVTGRPSSGGGSSGGGSSGDIALEQHILNHSNPHDVTKAQVGLDNVDNEKQYSVSNPPPYPVSSVNSKTRKVVLTAKDVGALPDTTKIPVKTSELDNDSGFLTKKDVNYPVTKVNNKTGEVVLSADDVGALPNNTKIPSKTSELDNDSDFIANSALAPYAKTVDVPTKTSQLNNDSGFVDAAGALAAAPVQSVNTKTGTVVLTQDDIGNGVTYVRTHNDFTDAIKQQINTNEDNIATIDSGMKAVQGDITTLKGNVTTLTTALQSKQDKVVGGASTITDDNLTANYVLVSDGNGKVAVSNVTNTELGYLDGVTSNVQTQLNKKLESVPVTSVNAKTGAVQLSASDVGAVDSSKITTTLTDSNEQIPTSKAVADAMSAAGYGDMLKAKYAPNSEDIVEKAYKDENGNNIKDTYQKKGGVLTNTDVNIVIESGNYFLGSGNTNIPNDCEGNIMMVGGAGNAAFQAIFKFSTNSIVHRCYNGTSWTAWRDTNTALIVSATQPTNQSPGDLWYQIVE